PGIHYHPHHKFYYLIHVYRTEHAGNCISEIRKTPHPLRIFVHDAEVPQTVCMLMLSCYGSISLVLEGFNSEYFSVRKYISLLNSLNAFFHFSASSLVYENIPFPL